MWFIKLFIIITLGTICIAYNILLVSPLPSGSHGILGDAFIRIFTNAGHKVTFISSMTKLKSSSNVTVINVASNIKTFPDDLLNIKAIMDHQSDMSDDNLFFPIMDNLSLVTMQMKEVQELLNDETQSFDVVIAEWMYNEVYAGLSTLYNCPLIWFSSLEPHWLFLRVVDEAPNPAYNSDSMSANVIPYTFSQRVQELWLQISKSFYREIWAYKDTEDIFNEIYTPLLSKRGRPVPKYNDVRYNGSLILGNSHAILGQATRLPQNYKPIGGFHIEEIVKPLPENLKQIMDNAKHGVIYFSMGSNLRSTDWPQKIKKELLELFGDLKQTVLWKFEETLADLPTNVHIVKWAPQQSILAHPKCVLFITHCGLLSTTEAIYFGVPIIGIPVFVDQFINAERAAKKGFGKKVSLSYSLVNELKVALNDILNNSRYRDKAKELSAIYHDRILKPHEEIVHWVEHVIRSNGATYLRSPALMLSWYQKLYLDLLAIIISTIIIAIAIIKYLMTVIQRQYNKTKIE
ncbi:PREDICTED: UDP-glucuronosyltransferase 2B9-like [Papilio xuthus]|uniref:UDP-glucuronosyltransferase n=1 Tax=Papilio xuthus TaxID=66420 RepID=A0AAJ7E7L7_PAPXU|nr:PREDICTED: UDP-glucuronosyltransferase 2B9-like [Papilio xuthus]